MKYRANTISDHGLAPRVRCANDEDAIIWAEQLLEVTV
jgi:hypothetical protein